MKLECNHCGYIWDYGGSQEFYATCPQCRYKVKIDKNQVHKEEKK